MYDVLVYGPLFCDLIFTGMPGMPVLGEELFADDLTITVGGSAIVAAGLHRLGVRVGLIAELGNDGFSQIIRELLDDLGVDRSLIREHPHPLPQLTVALSFPQDRAFVTRFERPATAPDLAQILSDHPARHLHVYGFLAALENPDAAIIAHEAGLTVSLDTGWDEAALRDPRLRAMVDEVDIFLPSEPELCTIAGIKDPEQAARRLIPIRPNAVTVVKRGARGVAVYTHEANALEIPAIPVTPVDTTGAGDAFDAGYLYAFLQDHSLKRCAQIGSICGGLATTVPGGAPALPTHTEVEQWLSKLPS